ncbi:MULTISPECIES: hypothetical protein [unclassified Chelatococcus]|uniref:hypothetical protein n=1 Tax=unclassified Chelatococcus TaxID=2638111 RepID=UPI001BD0F283|nr:MULTISPECIES: hypothetical protein [unclassified Chelatococcus]CAH1654791.1 hypothetical protein CHELA41_20965 [Hyphomicrobiales bacterium]MBS7740297.1 hypothetical protein [Chelatococcus sp. HY11]MBX3544873.1 hypothetical protein [Chelatococcus sp.]MCO5078462.1 hypothetical protein [Chelatococcus sp.]CAH1685312.1 hypothetical protein CHELA20_53962 [Hyphomicrobiales bacterium]
MTERPLNMVVDLLDLRSRVECDDEEVFRLRSEARVGRPEIDSPVGVITARRVFIQVELDGYDIRPGDRLGEPVKVPIVEETKVVLERNSSTSVGMNASVGMAADGRTSLSLGARGAAAVDAKTKSHTSSKTKAERGYVKAIGGDQWVIAALEPDGHLEVGTYVTDSDVLCELKRGKGVNRSAVRVSGYVKKRDLDFIPLNQAFDPLNWNKRQTIKAFLAKSIGALATDVGEKLIISEQEITNE